jgi:hypothetical protein
MFGPNAGGYMKGVSCWPKTFAILKEMGKHHNKGHSVSRSAAFAFQKGLGTSSDANRKLWYRHANYLKEVNFFKSWDITD